MFGSNDFIEMKNYGTSGNSDFKLRRAVKNQNKAMRRERKYVNQWKQGSAGSHLSFKDHWMAEDPV